MRDQSGDILFAPKGFLRDALGAYITHQVQISRACHALVMAFALTNATVQVDHFCACWQLYTESENIVSLRCGLPISTSSGSSAQHVTPLEYVANWEATMEQSISSPHLRVPLVPLPGEGASPGRGTDGEMDECKQSSADALV